MNTLFLFVGHSGSGKSELIKQMVRYFPDTFKPVKTFTTRPKRDEEDDLFYHFVTKEYIDVMEEEGVLVEKIAYAGNIYATSKIQIEETLKTHNGLMAVTEHAITQLKRSGFPIYSISVWPLAKPEDIRSSERKEEDKRRMSVPFKPNFIIINSFEEGGLDEAVRELAEAMFAKIISSKVCSNVSSDTSVESSTESLKESKETSNQSTNIL